MLSPNRLTSSIFLLYRPTAVVRMYLLFVLLCLSEKFFRRPFR
ncbi:hypothetical protein HMPREF9370_0575 [Neisseria wadsworthii 9715]|uniref:Uncharacterized protein n=1 Tax=Neisseria wadsworthii 9715 TaxID=1030841 RepID=G4CNB6_9NEIS|nr:hypothetical protein HMPREF9370_0575 [Neisseria wadsworthii 9715]